jgi:hypothetical protein
MAGAKDIKNVVAALLDKLENEGIYGVRAWFVGRPHIVVVPDIGGGWEVVMKRGGIMVKITLDENYNVVDVRVRYD